MHMPYRYRHTDRSFVCRQQVVTDGTFVIKRAGTLLSDHEFFIRSDYKDMHVRVSCTYVAYGCIRVDGRTVIAQRVHCKTQFFKALHTTSANAPAMLADTTRKDEHVCSSQHCMLSSDVSLDAITEGLDRQESAHIATVCCCENFPHVGTDARNAQQSTAVIQHFVQ